VHWSAVTLKAFEDEPETVKLANGDHAILQHGN